MSIAAPTRQRKVSIVIPAHNEEASLPLLYQALLNALGPLDVHWEAIIVDDGSTDGTWKEISRLHSGDCRLHGIRLSRNFGHQPAILAGLEHARGDAVVSMDADLQHPPALVPVLIHHWQNGHKVVNTIRRDTLQLPLLKRVTSAGFYHVFSFLTGVKLTPGMSDFRLLDRTVVRQLLSLGENRMFLRGLVEWLGYPAYTVEFEVAPRVAGKTKFTWRRMISFAISGITAFSIIPLRLGVLLGLATSLIAIYQLLEAIYTKVFTNEAVPGWASVIGLLSFLFAILFVLLGVIGEYLARVLEDVRARPRFVALDRLGFDDE